MATQPIIDLYAGLNHKTPMQPGGSGHLAPTWIPDDQRRRLTAYKILAAYCANCARIYLPEVDDQRREFGDADLIVKRTVAGVLGDTWDIVIDGADDRIDPVPELPEPPQPPADGAPPIQQRIHALAAARWEQLAADIVDQWERQIAEQPGLQARQQWLRDWADDEFLAGKITEAEGDAVGLSDGVYQLEWSHTKQRPTVTVYDPSFYFPVLDARSRVDDYPTRVHLAWEYETVDVEGKTRRYVRRLTYELTTIAAGLFDWDLGDFPRDEAGNVVLVDGDSIDRDGRIVRTYPWDSEPTDRTCVFTDATWELTSDLGPNKLDDLSTAKATYAFTEDGQQANRLDLHIDFIPVVHIPNTPATREHFGKSVLLIIAQLLDDLSLSDTDRTAARALASAPVIGMTGGTAGKELKVRPGIIWGLKDGGRMDVLDLTAGLEQLRLDSDSLLDRLSVNGQIPAEVLGRARAGTDGESGIRTLLRFGPFRQHVESMRMVRDQKYRLLLKMVQRLGQAGGVLEPGPSLPARLAFGAYLPSDRKATVDEVVALVRAMAISRVTGLAMLVEAGIPVEDAKAELDRILAEDTAGAVQVADATGSEALAARRLGLDLPEGGVAGPPAITLPGAGQ